MNSQRIWRTTVGGGSLLIGLSYAVLSVRHGFSVAGELVHAALFFAAGIALICHTVKPQREGSQMPGPLTSQQVAEYECAMETIGNALAVRSQAIHEERAKGQYACRQDGHEGPPCAIALGFHGHDSCDDPPRAS